MNSTIVLTFFLLIIIILINLCEPFRIVCEYNLAIKSYVNDDESLVPEIIDSKLCTHINFNYLSISNEFELMFNTEHDQCK